ncbi:MAG: DUF58 domain-containing protein [Calditrichaeota bacterium]|nr:DUF58 domain-containing protein [Calditrichota bacterium]TDI82914.1 MAG: DUF58 domain-containing protein [Caldithrix sp.]
MPKTEKVDSRKYLNPEILSKLSSMELRARLVVEGFITGLHKSPYHGFSVEFAEHRQYMPGDDIKHIDWKVYGKTDRFYVKQFEEETNLKSYLLLDASASMGYKSNGVSKLEYASYLASALAYLMLRQRDAVGLVTFDEKIRRYLPPRSVTTYLNQILLELDKTKHSAKTDIAGALHQMAERIKRRGLLILFSDLLDDPQRVMSGLRHFRHNKHEVIVFHILDPLELSFDFKQDAVFKDMEMGEEINTQPWHIMEDYQRQVAQFNKSYKKFCLEHQIEYVSLDTSQNYGRALLEYLQKRKRIGG